MYPMSATVSKIFKAVNTRTVNLILINGANLSFLITAFFVLFDVDYFKSDGKVLIYLCQQFASSKLATVAGPCAVRGTSHSDSQLMFALTFSNYTEYEPRLN